MPRQRDNDENNVLRSLRALRGFTQAEAAKRAGVSRALWSAWEGRFRPLSVAHLNLIQQVLDLSDEQIEDLRQWWGKSCFQAGTSFDEANLSARTRSVLEHAGISTVEQFLAETQAYLFDKIGNRAYTEVKIWIDKKAKSEKKSKKAA